MRPPQAPAQQAHWLTVKAFNKPSFQSRLAPAFMGFFAFGGRRVTLLPLVTRVSK
ncbi:MAG: hypothetical protein ACI9HX_000883 [Pseudoalteromonas tetraodonis]|jgi:hypothetical protein